MTRLTTNLTLALDAPIDLHMHTTSSDGRWPAEQLISFPECFASAAPLGSSGKVISGEYTMSCFSQLLLTRLAFSFRIVYSCNKRV